MSKSIELMGGLLIVTTKSQLEKWATVVRSQPTLSLHCYTDTLSVRRKEGAQHLIGYDVVITTFDVTYISFYCIYMLHGNRYFVVCNIF